ncbi:MAG: hypothetical protein JSW58_08370 [Candidatus Latescibacterota bacterium]|nr:MAG: hypothetical protein JSW58_08370 [Candidatus Latescibacterota bacterium]
MGEVPNYIGEFKKGDALAYPVDYYNSSWEPTHFDVIKNSTRQYLLRDVAMYAGANPSPDNVKWIILTLSETFFEDGLTYTIVVKDQVGQFPTDTTNYFFITFRLKNPDHNFFLGTVEKDKIFYFILRLVKSAAYYDVFDPKTGNTISTDTALTLVSTRIFRGSIDTSTSDFVEGRTYFLRVKDNTGTADWDRVYSFTVISPFEKHFAQMLSATGLNQFLDNFAYDQAGNITSLRQRIFTSASDVQNATAGVTDPEPGEILSIIVEQEHDVPRNVRTSHKSYVEFESNSFPADP